MNHLFWTDIWFRFQTKITWHFNIKGIFFNFCCCFSLHWTNTVDNESFVTNDQNATDFITQSNSLLIAVAIGHFHCKWKVETKNSSSNKLWVHNSTYSINSISHQSFPASPRMSIQIKYLSLNSSIYLNGSTFMKQIS